MVRTHLKESSIGNMCLNIYVCMYKHLHMFIYIYIYNQKAKLKDDA